MWEKESMEDGTPENTTGKVQEEKRNATELEKV